MKINKKNKNFYFLLRCPVPETETENCELKRKVLHHRRTIVPATHAASSNYRRDCGSRWSWAKMCSMHLPGSWIFSIEIEIEIESEMWYPYVKVWKC